MFNFFFYKFFIIESLAKKGNLFLVKFENICFDNYMSLILYEFFIINILTINILI